VNNVDKVVTHSVDIQTAARFTSKDKLRKWLKLHPNFERNMETGIYSHIYEVEAMAYQEKLNEQHNREDVQQQGSEISEEGGTSSGGDLPSGTEE